MIIQPKYVGILSCSGEECPGGTVSRIATLKVLSEYIPGSTITICVPLFLAGDEKEQDFVNKFPCITVDGCDKKCAARSVKNLGREPLNEVEISEVFSPEEWQQVENGPLHDLEWKNHPLCEKLALHVAEYVGKELNPLSL